MAKKATATVKPYGRQISGLKDQARAALGENALAADLATKANELAAVLNWDYEFTAESFAPKTTGGKRGRKPRQATPLLDGATDVVDGTVQPVARAVKAGTARNDGSMADAVAGLRRLIREAGAAEAHRLIDVLAD
jgi:hypothetical protein